MDLNSCLSAIDISKKTDMEKPLGLISSAFGFHVIALYKILNLVESELILEVVNSFDPEDKRPDIQTGTKQAVSLEAPEKKFINEVASFKNKSVSNLAGSEAGCSYAGFIDIPDKFGYGYILAGDFLSKKNNDIITSDLWALTCNLLGSILLKTKYSQVNQIDGLTGLYTPKFMTEELEKALKRLKRGKIKASSIALGDVDNLKSINDSFGFIQGDLVLSEIGSIILSTLRSDVDIAGRYAGEKILLLFEGYNEKNTAYAIERLRDNISKHKFKRVDKRGESDSTQNLGITLSFGIAAIEKNMAVENIQELLALAQRALTQSKNSGKNRITIASQNKIVSDCSKI
jgi:diguanylate cyclase (GGDEF)-like protein